MYKRIWYDNFRNTIHMWYIDKDGNHRYKKEKPPIEYYVADKSYTSIIRDIYGTQVKKRIAKTRKDVAELHKNKVATCEADLPEATKFLHRYYGTDDINIDHDQFQVATIDIECDSDRFPKPELAAFPINLITVHYSKQDQYVTYGLMPYTGDSDDVKTYIHCADETVLLTKFAEGFRRRKVDILTAWNGPGFDIPYIINRMRNLGIDISLSPVNQYREKKVSTTKTGVVKQGYEICGLSVLDGLDLYKQFEQRKRVSYTLDAIAKIELKKAKKKVKFNRDVDKTQEEWNLFVEYNVNDVVLLKGINDKKKYIQLAVEFCTGALIPFEGVFSSIARITGYILRFLHKDGVVLPDKTKVDKVPYPGAFVMAKPGKYNWLLSYDFESLYPNIMMAFNISPETLVYSPSETLYRDDIIRTPASAPVTFDVNQKIKLKTGKIKKTTVKQEFAGIHYKKDFVGVLPRIIRKFFEERKYWKNVMKVCQGLNSQMTPDEIVHDFRLNRDFVEQAITDIRSRGYTEQYCDQQQYVRKILINSIYGVCGSNHFAFYNPHNAAAVTIGGQTIIKYISNCINEYVKSHWHLVAKDVLGGQWELPDVIQPCKDDAVVLIDTDSSYLTVCEMLKVCNIKMTNAEFVKFADLVSEKFFVPMFVQKMDEFAKSYNIDIHGLNFKPEKIISQQYIFAKKKYATEVLASEGDVYPEPKLKVTGLEIVRTSTPVFCAKALQNTLEYIFATPDKEEVLDYIRDVKRSFMTAPIEDISTPTSISDYDKYFDDDMRDVVRSKRKISIKSGTPMHAKASICFNYLIEKLNLASQPVSNSSKVKYIPVKPNIYKFPVIAYTEEWDVLKEHFEPDMDLQFQKTYLNVVDGFFAVLGWGEIDLNIYKTKALFKRKVQSPKL